MCEFLSVVKKQVKGKDKYYYLTAKDLESPRGQELKLKYPGEDDVFGHTAIREFYGIREGQGTDREQTDFSTPENFPPEIVAAIKAGAFNSCPVPSGLLRNSIYADYHAKLNTIYADYQTKHNTIYADYKAKRNTIYADYQAKLKPIYADYQAKLNTIYADYWALFSDPKNRAGAWL